ncbi:DKNYY family protein, partial [Escherichia coli]|nr:DKNYY family protein [Escherichia coli]
KDRTWVQDVHVIATHGPLTMAEGFAWDDRYVYTWWGQRPSRTESPCPEQTVEQDDGIVIKTEASECHRSP